MADQMENLIEADLREFLKDFMSCAKHCWCAYKTDDPMIKRLKAKDIVEGFKRLPHEHGTDPDKCLGCLMEAGKISVS